MKYAVVQGCPVPAKLAPFLTQILRESGARLQSCYRGADAEALLHRLGKSSQLDLYRGFLQRRPGFNPANPPGHSTHELRNDGMAYTRTWPGGTHAGQWHTGDKLPWWACGIDIDDAHVTAFIAAAKKHGWQVARTYPNSTSEYHHVNFRRPPLRHRVKAHVRQILKRGK